MEKTEQPTQKKLREARRRGEVPRSRELGTAAMVLSVAVVLAATGSAILEALVGIWQMSLSAIGGEISAAPTEVLGGALAVGLEALAPVLIVLLLAGTLASFLQVGPLLSMEAVTPRLKRIDFTEGVKKLFSQRQAVELIKSIVKILVIGFVAYLTLRDALHGVVSLAAGDAETALRGTGQLVTTLLLRVGGAMVAIAVLDVFYQRWRHAEDQKMTREEVQREQREAEGDPHTKQARGRQHREILAHATLEEVRRADVLVVNPTHLAIALRYDEGQGMQAPEISAKGQDDLAQRMIAAAQQAGVPVLRDVRLAHGLFDLEVGDAVPEAFYEEAAAVLREAWRETSSET